MTAKKPKKPVLKPVVVPSQDLLPYEKPEIGVDQAQFDRINVDGSIWVYNGLFGSGTNPNARVKTRTAYGYISMKKCPELFEMAKKISLQTYTDLMDEVADHPYGIWSSNPLSDPRQEPLKIEEFGKTWNMDFIMFGFQVHRIKDFVQ